MFLPRFVSRRLLRIFPSSSLWRGNDFRKLFYATTLIFLGTAVSQMALPLTAIQLLGAGASQMGILAACQLLPFVTVGLPAGVWIDRSSKKKLAAAFDVSSACALALVPLGAWFGFLSMPILYLVGFMVSTTEAIGGSAVQVFITQLVGRDQLVSANSKLAAGSSIAMVVGPALAAVLVSLLGAPFAVLINVLGFAGSAFFVSRIAFREPAPKPSVVPFWQQMREGLVFVWRSPMLRGLVTVVAVWIMLADSFKALYVLHAAHNLLLAPGGIALINTLAALGGLAGAPLAHALARRLGIRNALLSGVVLAACGILAFTLPNATMAGVAVWSGLALMFFDCGAAIYVINYLTLRQTVTPDALLGRMVTSMRFITILPGPLGAIAIGRTGDNFGLVPTFVGIGIALLLVALVGTRCLPK
ncbi:MAG: MFS transporter [Formivibrio sp.]|nr:MFS transporter [Formivibrio sp.]